MAANIISFNCNGVKSFAPYIDRLLSKCDILCLQELMLTKQECMLLNSCHSEYYGYGVSPVDATLGVISGRPYGGFGFLWKKCFDASVSVNEFEFDWLCGIKICDGTKEYVLINVYLPYDCDDNRDDYSDCLAKLNVVIENINSTCITVIGDCNANLSKHSMFGDMLLNFCNENNVDLVDKSILPADTYTYVSSAWGTTSWLDHVVCTSDAKDCTTHVEVMYDCIFSDHHPVLVKADLNILAEVEHEHSNDLKQRIHSDNLPKNAIRLYEQSTNDGFNTIIIPNGVKCANPNCSCPSHANDIDTLYDSIIKVLSECSKQLENDKHISKKCGIPGWNDLVKDVSRIANCTLRTFTDLRHNYRRDNIQHGSCMYVAFLDASKAFDRVNHTKLFSKLLRLGVPTWIIKVLVQWYCNQSMCVRWGSVFSDFFLVNRA